MKPPKKPIKFEAHYSPNLLAGIEFLRRALTEVGDAFARVKR